MKIALIAHGFVQGVGYRYFVKRTANALGVNGMVRNQSDGSVLIVAEGDEETLRRFESAINVSQEHGIQVMKIEKIAENDESFPRVLYDTSKFVIKK